MKTYETPIDQVENIFAYFHDPAHSAEIQLASDKTQYVWQHMSGYYPTEQILRNGPIFELPEHMDPVISTINVTFRDGTAKTVDEHFDTSTMDAMLVIRDGSVVYERYKTMRSFDKHNWFSCSKSIVGTSLALLEHEGMVNVMKPVSHYLPELAGSEWDTVTVEETLDMATGLDSTEHEEEDARTNPERGWYKWGMSIGVLAPVGGFNQSPVDVLRAMKRIKPGHEVFEYNSIDTYICQRIVETVTQTPLIEFFDERVWRRIGAQNDGYMAMDKQGHALGFGFMNSTLRDLGRYGMIFTPSSSKLSPDPIVPQAVIRKFQTGLHPEMYTKGAVGGPFQEDFFTVPGLANRYQWDVVTPDGDLFKAGVGGQGLWISPSHDAVVAFFSTGDARDERLGAWVGRNITQTFGA